MTLSHERDNSELISEQTLALFLEDNSMDQLTDILVDSLEETLSLLRDEYCFETVH
ncbi:hypothetical protein [Rhizobium halophilum]|uniref:hypothetical protein n=1 Tax=Rhizobium halophilum TaxID=2846852 RepID=UPI001EFDAEDC|nr:hypothetical protein [Rhizobium halophilum]MCF6369220.1 hypothetical protein [Rhizobium halophilum]